MYIPYCWVIRNWQEAGLYYIQQVHHTDWRQQVHWSLYYSIYSTLQRIRPGLLRLREYMRIFWILNRVPASKMSSWESHRFPTPHHRSERSLKVISLLHVISIPKWIRKSVYCPSICCETFLSLFIQLSRQSSSTPPTFQGTSPPSLSIVTLRFGMFRGVVAITACGVI